MVEYYMDLLDTMIVMGLISKWDVMYKTIGLTVEQYTTLLADIHRDRKYLPEMAHTPVQSSMIYKARYFQVNFEVRHDQGN